MPINIIHNMRNICYTINLHLKILKSKIIQYYTWYNFTLILLCRETQPNPNPLSHITKTSLKNTHKCKGKISFQYNHIQNLLCTLRKIVEPYKKTPLVQTYLLNFLEPLLRWLEKTNMGYHFNTPSSTCTTSAYANDLTIIYDKMQRIQPQINKFKKFKKMGTYGPWSIQMCHHKVP